MLSCRRVLGLTPPGYVPKKDSRPFSVARSLFGRSTVAILSQYVEPKNDSRPLIFPWTRKDERPAEIAT